MVKVLRDYLAVSKEEAPERSAGGIFIAHLEQEKSVTGTVLAVGSGRVSVNGTVVPLEVSVGDKIVFNKNLATEIKDGDQTVLILREDHVLAVLNS